MIIVKNNLKLFYSTPSLYRFSLYHAFGYIALTCIWMGGRKFYLGFIIIFLILSYWVLDVSLLDNNKFAECMRSFLRQLIDLSCCCSK